MYEQRITCFYAPTRQRVKQQDNTFLNSSSAASLFHSFKTRKDMPSS
jgi:hypothetical protein